MALLGTFIEQLALISGNGKLESLKPFIEANKAIEIPDDLVSGINGGILTLESAKNNSIVSDHFLATARGRIDREIYDIMKESGFDETIINEVKQEEKTTQKVRQLAAKIKELEAKKISTSGGDKKVLGEKIADLEKQIADANAAALQQKETFEAKVKEAENEFTGKLRDYQVDKHFQGYTYANDKIPMSVNIMMARGLFDQKAKEIGLKTVFDKETGQVKLLTVSDTIYYKDNKQVDFKGFTDSLLAENHLLKVSDKPPEKGASDNQFSNIVIKNGQSNTPTRDTSKFAESLNKSLSEVKVVHN